MKQDLRRAQQRSVIRRRHVPAAWGWLATGMADGGLRPFPPYLLLTGGR